MLNDVGVIGLKITVLPRKNISKFFDEGTILENLGRRQVSGQIYVL